jgi:hypothetical protein
MRAPTRSASGETAWRCGPLPRPLARTPFALHGTLSREAPGTAPPGWQAALVHPGAAAARETLPSACVRRRGAQVVSPFGKDGVLAEWDVLEALYDHAFK